MDKYNVISLLGEGSFGRVYKAKRISDSTVVALKVISKVHFHLFPFHISHLFGCRGAGRWKRSRACVESARSRSTCTIPISYRCWTHLRLPTRCVTTVWHFYWRCSSDATLWHCLYHYKYNCPRSLCGQCCQMSGLTFCWSNPSGLT